MHNNRNPDWQSSAKPVALPNDPFSALDARSIVSHPRYLKSFADLKGKRFACKGGTFDLIHMGHIADIPVVQEQMSLDAVVLIPSKIHQVKHAEDKQTIFTPAQRMGMALLAAEQYSNVYVSPSDLEAPEAVTRTDITLRRIHAEVGNEPGDKILWIAGFDSLESLPHWADPNTVLKLASFIVVPRNGKGLAQIDTLGHQHPDLFPLTVITELKENFVQVPELPISSSELKRDLLAGRPLGNQVPDKVAEYLQTL